MIEGLKSLLESAKSPYQRSRVLLALNPAQFDFSTSSGSGFMPTEAWHRYNFKYVDCFSLAQNISTIMQLFEENKNLVITEGVEAPVDDLAENKKAEDGEKVELLGSFVDRLDEEFRKSMQQLDPPSYQGFCREIKGRGSSLRTDCPVSESLYRCWKAG